MMLVPSIDYSAHQSKVGFKEEFVRFRNESSRCTNSEINSRKKNKACLKNQNKWPLKYAV